PEDPSRSGRHPLEQRLERQQAGLDEVRVERGECGLEAGHAERGRLERHLLLVRGMRCVVGGDRLDRPVPQALEQREPILLGPERRGSSSLPVPPPPPPAAWGAGGGAWPPPRPAPPPPP